MEFLCGLKPLNSDERIDLDKRLLVFMFFPSFGEGDKRAIMQVIIKRVRFYLL